MSLINRTLGIVVAAVVLMVVAVPIFAGLGGTTIQTETTVECDEHDTGETLYYRPISMSNTEYPYLMRSSVTDGSIEMVWKTSQTEEERMTYTLTPGLPLYYGNEKTAIYSETVGYIRTGHYSAGTSSAGTNQLQWIAMNYNTGKLEMVTGQTSSYDVSADTMILCPKSLATLAAGHTMISDGAIDIHQPMTFTRMGGTIVFNGSVTETQYLTEESTDLELMIGTYTHQSTTYGSIIVNALSDGIYEYSLTKSSITITNSGTTYTAESGPVYVIVPLQTYTIITIESNESEYAWLIWTLPVLMALVLVASMIPMKKDGME